MKWILGVSIAEHDASICLLKDGEIVLFLQEERTSRTKHDSLLPLSSLREVKNYTDTIDFLICVNADTEKDFKQVVNTLKKHRVKITEACMDSVLHHDYHSSCGFYSSGFETATCLVIDGWGGQPFDNFEDTFATETCSMFECAYPDHNKLIFKRIVYDPYRTEDINEDDCEQEEYVKKGYEAYLTNNLDIGVIYGTISMVLGFSRHDGGKTMGLASYGVEDPEIPPMFANEEDLITNMNLFKTNRGVNTKAYPIIKLIRESKDFQKMANLAYSVQKAIEKIFIRRVEYIIQTSKYPDNIILSGGCALNVVANSVLKKRFPNINFYIDPIPNDAGQSIGAAKYHYHKMSQSTEIKPLKTLYNGPEYHPDILKKIIELEVNKHNLLSSNK